MRRNNSPRAFSALALCSIGALLAVFSFAAKSAPPAGGTGWSVFASPNPSGGGLLTSVTCASASNCWAVGYNNPTPGGGIHQTVIEHWNGTSWTIVNSPNSSVNQYNELHGVTCVSASDCWAVGFYYNGSYQTLIEHWNGTSWTIVNSPNTSATQSNQLHSVTCISASDCWAAGDYVVTDILGDQFFQTLVEHWNGTSWTIVSSPNTITVAGHPLAGNRFFSVTCASTSECWAVGYSDNGNAFVGEPLQTLIEHWNGTSWTIVTSPNNGTATNLLNGVTCVSASQCLGVGFYYNGSVFQTLIEQWNGNSWAIVTSPNTSTTENNTLGGVTCPPTSNCWTVGESGDRASGVTRTLIEQWNGTSWAIVTSPNPSVQDNELLGVTCPSTSECWAVGIHSDSVAVPQTLIEHYTAP
jgi:hypothetical protein